MKPAPALKLVPQAPAEKPVNVSDLVRADIAARPWDRVHIDADRAKPLTIGERIRRTWRR